METKPILVAVDFTESSDVAVEEARGLAIKLGASLSFGHVVALPSASPAELMGRAGSDLRSFELAHEELQRLVEETQRQGIVADQHLCVGAVVMGLLDLIARVQPTLVITGSHGKGFLGRALLGSVAESLVRRSPVPVLVVPSPRRRRAAEHAAWMCRDCGHILDGANLHCPECGASPAHWISAPIAKESIDFGEPTVGEVERETVTHQTSNEPAGLFATSPAGVGNVDVNPELRVRY